MARTGARVDHDTEAFMTLARGLLDPAEMPKAKDHPVLQPILSKLSENDLNALSEIAKNQQATACNLIVHHTEAFTSLARGLLDPAEMSKAKDHPVLQPILSKLSENDLSTLSEIAKNQQATACNV